MELFLFLLSIYQRQTRQNLTLSDVAAIQDFKTAQFPEILLCNCDSTKQNEDECPVH